MELPASYSKQAYRSTYSPFTHFYRKRIVYRSSRARAAAAGRPAASGTLLEATRAYPALWSHIRRGLRHASAPTSHPPTARSREPERRSSASLGETCHGAAAAAARNLLALVAHATISHATAHLCPSRCLPCHDWWPDRRASSLCHAFAVPDLAPSPRALAWVNGWLLLLLLLLLLLGCRAASDSISATAPQPVPP